MVSIARMIAMSGGDDESPVPPVPPTPPDVLAVTLREVYGRFVAGCPFEPGDIVTPRRGYNYKQVGTPQAVLKVFGEPLVEWDSVNGGSYCMNDMMVAAESRGNIVTFLAESWAFEEYRGPVADTSDAAVTIPIPAGDADPAGSATGSADGEG